MPRGPQQRVSATAIKQVVVSVRLTAAETAHLDRCRGGLSRSLYLASLVRKARPVGREPGVDART